MLVDEKNGSRKIASTRQGAVSVLRCIDNWVIPLSWHLAVRRKRPNNEAQTWVGTCRMAETSHNGWSSETDHPKPTYPNT